MARTKGVKCKKCGKSFAKETLSEKGRCVSCETEIVEMRNLTDYYASLFLDENITWQVIMKRFKDLKTNYNLSFRQIQAILRYMVEIENMSYDEDIDKLIPYYIDKAKRHYYDLERLSRCKVYGFLTPEVIDKERLITPKPNRQNVGFIDLTEL